MNVEEAIKFLEAHGYKVSKPKARKMGEYHEAVLSLIASYLSYPITAADLAAENDLRINTVGEACHTLFKAGKIKMIGRGPSRTTGHVGRRWVATQYADAAQRSA